MTWTSGGVLHANTTVSLDAINGTAPLRCQSATLCLNLNAHMLCGATRDEIISVDTLKKIRDIGVVALQKAGYSNEEVSEMTTFPEIEVADRFANSSRVGKFGDINAVTTIYIREDRDSTLTTSDIFAHIGGVANASGTQIAQSVDSIAGSNSR